MSLILLNPSSLISISDGDTPEVKMGVRMVGIDTPELHFPGNSSPEKSDPLLAKLPSTAQFKKLPKELREYLEPRLEKGGEIQKKWALKAKEALERIVSEGLKREKGGRRKVFLACGKEVIDCYGRILAFAGPFMTKEEREEFGQPDTFNLRMLKEGFAVSNIHFPNIPKEEDIKLAVDAVRNAKKKGLGFWKEKQKILLGYEFRALVRLAKGEKGFRYKVGDLREILAGKKVEYQKAEEYIFIPEEYRVFK